MHDFICNKNVISDEPRINKCILGRRNDEMKDPLKPISQNLGNNFIDDIVKADRFEFSNF